MRDRSSMTMKLQTAIGIACLFVHHAVSVSGSSFTTDQSTTEDISVTTCGHLDCVNGDDRNNCVATCNCDVGNLTYYHGNSCETIILDGTVDIKSSARTCNLTWELPPNIDQSNYQFVYMAIGKDENGTKPDKEMGTILEEIYKQDFNMIEDNIARVTNLESGGVIYTLCVIENSEANDLVKFQNDTNRINSSNHDDCVDITTQNNDLRWEYTIAAYVVSGFLILVVIVLIVAKFVADQLAAKKKEKYQQLIKQNNEENEINQHPAKKAKRDKPVRVTSQGARKTTNSISYSDRSNYMDHILASQMVHSKHKKSRNTNYEGSENVAFEQEQSERQSSQLFEKQAKNELTDQDSEPDADY